MSDKKTCVKCKADMELGFIVDHDDRLVQMRWVRGEPKKSAWSGLSIENDQMYKTVTYRCVKCGFLEHYSTDQAGSYQ